MFYLKEEIIMKKSFKRTVSVFLALIVLVFSFSVFAYAAKPVDEVYEIDVNDQLTLRYLGSEKLNVSVFMGEEAEYTVEFTSSNPKVVSVDEDGVVKSNKSLLLGTAGDPSGIGIRRVIDNRAIITCTVTDSYGNTFEDECHVTVKPTIFHYLVFFIYLPVF